MKIVAFVEEDRLVAKALSNLALWRRFPALRPEREFCYDDLPVVKEECVINAAF
jgi:hypothetical protein